MAARRKGGFLCATIWTAKNQLIDLRTPFAEGMKDTLPVYYYFNFYGWKVIHWFAAVRGCDISVDGNVIDGIVRVAFVRVLRESEDEGVRELEPFKFAKKLRNLCRPDTSSNTQSNQYLSS